MAGSLETMIRPTCVASWLRTFINQIKLNFIVPTTTAHIKHNYCICFSFNWLSCCCQTTVRPEGIEVPPSRAT